LQARHLLWRRASPSQYHETGRQRLRRNNVVKHTFRITDEIGGLAPDIEVVATFQAGSEHIAMTISSKGIEVIKNPGRESDAILDFAAALIIDAIRRVTWNDEAFRLKGWTDAVKSAGRTANVREITID